MIARIILGIITTFCFFVFFTYDNYEWTREKCVLVVEAKASSLRNGQFSGAFLIYREVKDSIAAGEPKTVLVDEGVFQRTQIGDFRTEFVRSQFAYILFVVGCITFFLLILSVNPDFTDLLDSLIDGFT